MNQLRTLASSFPFIALINALAIQTSPPIALAQETEAPTATAVKDEGETKTVDVKRPLGHVVDGPTNMREFSPEDTGTLTIPADQIDLRKVFEDLGPDATLWYQHVQTLANPFFEGRAPGTHGMGVAADYIEFYLKSYGLEPAFTSNSDQLGGKEVATRDSFRQPFDFAAPTPKVNVVTSAVVIADQNLENDKDFAVLGVSGSGMVMAPLTFCGYGFEQGKDDYTSFDANTDLRGRIAVVMRYEPLDDAGHSRWAESRFSRFAALAPKFKALADRDAAGIILVNPPGAIDGKSGLESIKDSSRFGPRMSVPVFQVTTEVADRLLSKADPEHRDLMAWRKLADEGKVKSVNLGNEVVVTMNSQVDFDDRIETENIAGVIRGKGNLADRWIVIGGHYDHVGTGYTGVRSAQNIGKLHPGADDNASGTAGVLIAAKRLMRDYEQAPKGANLRSLMLVTFSAEEPGLYGSKYLAKHLPMPKESIDLMINMDMIGRLRSNNLLVQGLGTAEGFQDMLQRDFESSGLTISKTPGGRGPSDHSNFYDLQIPVLFLFTGEHAEYHMPTDRAYTVNPAGAVRVIDLLESITMDMAARAEHLKFVANTQGGAGRPGASRVRFGIQPDYAAELETGVLVDSVSENTSAAEAGIKSGDVLLKWNDADLTGGAKLMEFISKAEPGDKVKITLVRDKHEITVNVTLKAREGE